MFSTYKLSEKGFSEVKVVKTTMSNACNLALALMPEGREKAVFKTKMEEAMFFGTKALASKEGNHLEVINYSEIK